jgi:hypothetical protein
LDNFINPQLKETSDKSFTLVHPIYNQTYHSINGAFTESVCVFISAGLNAKFILLFLLAENP